jgi:general secretion pathway protein F
MGDMMERISSFHDEEIARWVEWATKLIEPILMIVIGVVIGGIIILMYIPIFDLAGSIN